MATRKKAAESQTTFDMGTPDGTPLNVAVSAMIKNLRRANELEAYYWAKQIEERYWKYLWRRLLIFASEDVGIGNPQAVVQVRALYENYVTVKSESKNPIVDRSIVSMAVLVLARSPKNRETDNLLNVFEHLKGQNWRAEVPDEAYDLHTQEGKRRIPREDRLRHWIEEASKVFPLVGMQDYALWLLRWAMTRGKYTREEVDARAQRWADQGMLLYGVEGVPGWDAALYEDPPCNADPDEPEVAAPIE